LTHTRFLSIVTAALLGSGLLAACGGGGGSEDPQQVIDQTFSPENQIQSADIDLTVSGNAEGDQGGSFGASLSGPVQGQSGKVPKFDLTGKLDASTAGQSFNFEGGLTSTGTQGFVNYKGTDYELPANVFSQFKSSYEQAQAQQQKAQGLTPSEAFQQGCTQGLTQNGSSESAASEACEIDFTGLLTNLSNEGDEDVGGVTTIHVSADANVEQIAKDFAKLVQATPQGQALPQSQIDQIVQQASDAVDTATIDVYSGKDDHLLRKLALSLKVTPPSSAGSSVTSVSLNLSLTLNGVNEEQTVEAPSNPKSISELGSQIPGLGALGALGGASSSGGSSGSTPTLPGAGGGGGGGAATPSVPGGGQINKAYLDCVAKAQDQAALQACSKEL
jgi:hypothetical protein